MATTESDEERLRKALRLIGAEVGRPDPVRRPRRRRGGMIAGALVTAAVLVIGVLTLSLGDFSGDDGDIDGAGQGQTYAEGIACATFIGIGEVVDVRASDEPDRIIVTFNVQEPIKPAEGTGKMELDLLDPSIVDQQFALSPGDHVLLEVPQRRDMMPSVSRGAEIEHRREIIERWLPEAAETTCPPYWREGSTVDPPAAPGAG